jgi:hypothetical protein
VSGEIRPEVRALIERGEVTLAEARSLNCSLEEWGVLVPDFTDEALFECVEKGVWLADYHPDAAKFYMNELVVRYKGSARAAKAFAETVDNVRAALGQEGTHYLVVADDVEELVKAVELCESDGGCRAMTVLRKLREQ